MLQVGAFGTAVVGFCCGLELASAWLVPGQTFGNTKDIELIVQFPAGQLNEQEMGCHTHELLAAIPGSTAVTELRDKGTDVWLITFDSTIDRHWASKRVRQQFSSRPTEILEPCPSFGRDPISCTCGTSIVDTQLRTISFQKPIEETGSPGIKGVCKEARIQ